MLDFFDHKRLSLLRLAVEAFLSEWHGILLLMLPNVSRHAKDLIVRVPRQLLNRRQIVFIFVWFIAGPLVHTASLSSI